LVVNVAQAAPGALEDVRGLLNTWLIPNDTRAPTDVFDGADELRELRDDLRRAVEEARPELVNPWIERLGIRPSVDASGVTWSGSGPGAPYLGAVLRSIADGTWSRLKACPDCRWVFYDHTRNASKRWCLMTAGGPGGRSCGSIAKVRAYRERAGR
jgi:predicted RNA-binding Zn ribbon-like protein